MSSRDEWTSEASTDLFEAILALRDIEEAERFFRDLCTLNELNEMSRRWEIARALGEGLSYRQIADRTGSSTATITRISQWLHHGEGGYRLVLDRMSSLREDA